VHTLAVNDALMGVALAGSLKREREQPQARLPAFCRWLLSVRPISKPWQIDF